MSNQAQDVITLAILYSILYGAVLGGYLTTDRRPVWCYHGRHWARALGISLLWLLPVVVCHYIFCSLYP